MRRAILLVVLSSSPGGCEPAGPPDTPAAREAVAACSADAPLVEHVKGVPHRRFRAAFEAAAKVAVSSDMQAVTRRYGELDLAEHAAALRSTAAAVGVRECRLADELDKMAAAEPSPRDCDALVNMLEGVAALSEEPELGALIASGCSELPGCARECVPGLAGVAAAPADQRAQVLASGCAAFRPQMSGGTDAVRTFARGRLAAFVDACGPYFGGQTGRVAALRRQAGI